MATEPTSLSKILAATRTQLHAGVEKFGLKKTKAVGKGQPVDLTDQQRSTLPLEKKLYPLGELSTESQYYPHGKCQNPIYLG